MTKLDAIMADIADLPRQDIDQLRKWLEDVPNERLVRRAPPMSEAERRAWLAENGTAIDDYNALANGGHVLLSEEDPLF